MPRTVQLNPREKEALFGQDPNTGSDGGWQGLLVNLQEKFDPATMLITLDDEDLEKIPRHAFAYGNGGWEKRLLAIFERTLGSRLGGNTGP